VNIITRTTTRWTFKSKARQWRIDAALGHVLKIFDNSDMDESIDEEDIEYVQVIIKGPNRADNHQSPKGELLPKHWSPVSTESFEDYVKLRRCNLVRSGII